MVGHFKVVLIFFRIPFFFEPNFTANVKPLAAALRMQAGEDTKAGSITSRPVHRSSVVYGDFLLSKVSNNFSGGKGRYED